MGGPGRAVHWRFWAAAAVVFLGLLWLLNDILLPFVVGMAVAYFLDPVVTRLQRLGLSRTLATTARERGLEPLAVAIWTRDPTVASLDEFLQTMVNPEKELNTIDDVRLGVKHFEHTICIGRRSLDGCSGVGNRIEWCIERVEVGDEKEDRTGRHPFIKRIESSYQQNRGRAEHGDKPG